MRVCGLIPARLQSSRLPRKLLLRETGKPLIQYVWEAAKRSARLNRVLVATDSEEIRAAVEAFGGEAVMTGEHPSGTDRIAEAAARHAPEAEILVNIQGDEPELNPGNIDRLVEELERHPDAAMATLATPLTSEEEILAPSCVKVVRAGDGRALYFSRSVIPHVRDASVSAQLAAGDSPWLLHVGIYAYRRDFLNAYTRQPPSPLEQLEKLEQLRALEMGIRLQVRLVEQRSVGIDTPEDYARFLHRQRVQPS